MGLRLSGQQRGIALTAVLAVVVVLAAVGGGGYFLYTRNNSTAETEVSRRALNECTREIDDKDLCKFVSNWSFSGEYRMTIQTTGMEEDSTYVVEVNGLNSSTVMTAADGEQTRFIFLDGATYTYNSETDKWIKFTSGITENLVENFSDRFNFDDTDTSFIDGLSYENLGKEACGELNCFKYRITDPEEPATEQYIYFDDKDYKLRQFVIIEEESRTQATFEYVSVTITEPSPVEEFAPVEGLPSEADFEALLNSIRE